MLLLDRNGNPVPQAPTKVKDLDPQFLETLRKLGYPVPTDLEADSGIYNASYTTPLYNRGLSPSQPKRPGVGEQVFDAAKGVAINQAAKEALKAGGVSAGDLGGAMAIFQGALGAGKVLGSNAPADVKAREARQQAENAALGFATGGISNIVQLADSKLFGGKLEGLRDKLDKYGPGRIIDPITTPIIKQFGGKKDKDQLSRDAMRGYLKKIGLLDEDSALTLASGNKYNIGFDGRPNEKWGVTASGDALRPFELDLEKNSGPQGQILGFVNPLALILTGGDPKLASDFAGYFTKAAASSNPEDINSARASAMAWYKQAGMDSADKAYKSIDDLLAAGKIDNEQAAAYKSGIDSVFGIGQKPSATEQAIRKVLGEGGVRRRQNRRRGVSIPNEQEYTPNVYSINTTSPMGSSSSYGDSFAKSLANVYLANQGKL